MKIKNESIALILGIIILLLPVSQAQEFEPTPFEPMRPEHLPAPQSPYSNPLNSQALQVLINSLSTIFNVETITGLISDMCSGLILQVTELIKSGGSISGYLNIVLNGLNALYTTVMGIGSSIVGMLPGSVVALLSGGVAILNTVGTLFVMALQAVGFTIEGIVGLTAIGGLISGALSIVSILMNVLNFAYTSGVAGIAVVALLLVVLSFVGLAVLGGAIVVLAVGEAILFVLVAVLFIIGFFAAIVTLGLACILFGIVITILTGMSAIGFTIISVIELIMKVMTTLMNTVSVPTSVFTSIPSWLGLLFCNLPASCLTTITSWCGIGISCFYTISPIVFSILIFLVVGSILLAVVIGTAIAVAAAILFLFVEVVIGLTLMGFVFGLVFFFVLGFLWMPIIGAVVGLIFWIIISLAFILGMTIAVIFAVIISFLLYIVIPIILVLFTAMLLPPLNLFFNFIFSSCLSLCNFLTIIPDAITGFAGLIITGITLMLLRVGIDLMQTTLISEVVSVLVLFLQKLQEISFLTKMVAYPIEVCVGITMLCAAICMFLLNILFYPFNFVWQFVDMCLKGCYGVVCKPFIRPLGWS